MRIAAFILSDVRSGSTLLDQCLGAHTEIVTLGEAHWLPAYVTQDRAQYDPVHELVCACGRQVGECPFWNAVRCELGRPLESLNLHSRFVRSSRDSGYFSRIRYLPRRVVREHPQLYRLPIVRRALGGARLAIDVIGLLEAASRASGRSVCVDSSKSPFRFRAVYGRDAGRARAIVLARDFRAVVHSKMKRGESLEAAARGWRLAMAQIDTLTQDLPGGHVHRLRYEDLCIQPRAELGRLCEYLGIPFQDAMLRRPEKTHLHHIGGSPSKFDESRHEIVLDRAYEGAFSPADVDRMRRIVGNEARRWSY
jgi:hypothetical protein